MSEVAKAEAEYQAGRSADAERMLLACLTRRPGHARALNSLAWSFTPGAEKDESPPTLPGGVKSDMNCTDAILNLTDSLAEVGLHSEALASVRVAST